MYKAFDQSIARPYGRRNWFEPFPGCPVTPAIVIPVLFHRRTGSTPEYSKIIIKSSCSMSTDLYNVVTSSLFFTLE